MRAKDWIRQTPWPIVAPALGLMTISLLSLKRCDALNGTHYAARQLLWIGVALVGMLLAAAVDYRRLSRWSYPAFAVALVALAAVYFFPASHGARRWIRIGPVGFQPSEFAKLAFVLAVARYGMTLSDGVRRLRSLIAPLALTLAPALLVLKEPDLGTALVFFPALFVMLLAAGARWDHLILGLVAGVLLIPMAWSHMSREQQSRVTALADQSGPAETPSEDDFHLHAAKRMFALGGYWGSWLRGESATDRAAYSVPEAHTDSISCVVAERFGLWGLAITLGLVVLLAWSMLTVAANAEDPFGRLLAAGIATILATQSLVNLAMMVGLAPITGLTLPFVSYGGSSLVASAMGVGMVMSVARRRARAATATNPTSR